MQPTDRRSILAGTAAAAASWLVPGLAHAQAQPGVTATELRIATTTSPTDHRPLEQMQLQRWGGKAWERFGNIIEGAQL